MTVPYLLRCCGLEGVVDHPPEGDPSPVGLFLHEYDPEAHDGQGTAIWGSLRGAVRFASALDALNCWRQVPRSRPTRPDGEPNRPLAAFSVEIVAEHEVR